MKKNKYLLSTVINTVLVVFLLIVAIYPVLWLILSSLKTQTEFTMNSAFSLPQSFNFENYVKAWNTGNMGTSFVNSIICTVGSMLLIVVTAVPLSFALVKMKWKHRLHINRYILIGMMVPIQVALIPLFTIYSNLGLTNSRIGLILIYTAYSLPLSVTLLTGFFESVPNDGCNIYQVLGKVVFPLMTNSIMTVLTLQFMSSWNDLIFSQTMISKTELQTIPTALIMFNGSYGQVDWGPLFVALSIAVIPTLVLYLFLSKFMIRGMTAGAIKG